MALAHAPAGQEDLIARLIIRRVGGLDATREIDARHEGQLANDLATASNGQRVLVVESGTLDGHRDRQVR